MLKRFLLASVAFLAVAPDIPAQSPVKPRTDGLGDPLPASAVARLGTLRLKHEPALDPTVDAAIFSPDGKWICSWVAGRASIRLWDAATGKEMPGPWTASDKRFTAVAFSPDSAVLAAAIFANALGIKLPQLAEGVLPHGLN